MRITDNIALGQDIQLSLNSQFAENARGFLLFYLKQCIYFFF